MIEIILFVSGFAFACFVMDFYMWRMEKRYQNTIDGLIRQLECAVWDAWARGEQEWVRAKYPNLAKKFEANE